MSVMASQITGVSIVCSSVCSGADQRKHQSSTPLVFVRGKFELRYKYFLSRKCFYISKCCQQNSNPFVQSKNNLTSPDSSSKNSIVFHSENIFGHWRISSMIWQPFCSVNRKVVRSLNWLFSANIFSLFNVVTHCLEAMAWLILDLRPANERRCYKVALSLIGRVQT